MITTIKPTQYIFPPRSQDSIPFNKTELFANMDWQAQLKYNDTHAMIKYTKTGTIELWTRHAEKFRSYTPPNFIIEQLWQLHETLGLSKQETNILDGGILDNKHCAIRDVVVIWDILVRDSQHLLNTTYKSRYDSLLGNADTESWYYTNPTKPNTHTPLDFGIKLNDNILIPRNIEGYHHWQETWNNTINTANAPYTTGKPSDKNYDCKPVIEGLVIKNPSGKLKQGIKEKNNSEWIIRTRVATGRHPF